MDDDLLSLDEIGIQHGTDKSSRHHDYLSFYERFFAKWRMEPLKILEIGVLNGASLRTWEAYFPHATIVGADINFRVGKHAGERVTIEILDQSNVQDLVDLGTRHGPFDIVIEDGSHMWEHQITSLKTIFPFVKPHGYYVVEDLQTNYGEMGKLFTGIATMSCMDYLKRLLDFRVADEVVDISAEEDAFLRTYGRAVEFMTFYRHSCLIEKGPRLRPNFTNTPLAPLDWDTHALPLNLVAHLGHVGDRENRKALFINGSYCLQFIQGFGITAQDELAGGIEYRARLARGEWTDWMPGNSFAGSRGKGQNLTGYAVRLNTALAANFELVALGAFAGQAEPVSVAGGEDCVPDDMLRPMSGMHILVKRKI